METAVLTNTAIVQQCYGYFSTGNIPALLEHVSEDVHWYEPGPKEVLPWVGTHVGKSGVGRFFMLLDQEVEFKTFEPREFIEQDDKVVVIGYMEGKSKRTGKTSATDWAMLFTMKNGKIEKFREFSDTYQAVKAFSY
jgi:ketosteroid isomerase-like protein